MSKMEVKKDLMYYLDLPYSKVLKKDPYGGYFVSVKELKGCVSQGETEIEALENINEAMASWIQVALDDGDVIPEPGKKEYSGKFVLRIPKSLHRELDNSAREEGISLNLYVTQLLSGEYNKAKTFKEMSEGPSTWSQNQL